MTRTRKIITATLAAATLGATVAATATPAAAWHHHHYGYGYGWGGPAIAGGLIGGLALGAMAAAASQPSTCIETRPVYNRHGHFRGYRRFAVAC